MTLESRTPSRSLTVLALDHLVGMRTILSLLTEEESLSDSVGRSASTADRGMVNKLRADLFNLAVARSAD